MLLFKRAVNNWLRNRSLLYISLHSSVGEDETVVREVTRPFFFEEESICAPSEEASGKVVVWYSLMLPHFRHLFMDVLYMPFEYIHLVR